TSTTQFDHKYTHNGTRYENIDQIVDDIFAQYIVKPGELLPFLAQYRAGRRGGGSPSGFLSQWGSQELALKGMNYKEILVHYYKSVEIRFAKYVEVTKSFKRPLKEGDSGEDVRTAQTYLTQISKKYHQIPKVNSNGTFGPETTSAVKAFQKIFSLSENGIIDDQTWDQLSDRYVLVTNLPGILPVLHLGSRGEMVKRLQILLNKAGFFAGSADGDFGPGTEKAVKEFQSVKGLTVTGIARKQTWKVLEGLELTRDESRTSFPTQTNSNSFNSQSTLSNKSQHLPGYYAPYPSQMPALLSNTPESRNPWSAWRSNYYHYNPNGYYYR
ncbi:peptidoglycan-binding protein, partial [Peribacillus sp. NPDC060186]